MVDKRFGHMVTPGTRGVPVGIKEGSVWAADNQAFTQRFDPIRYFGWLQTMEQYKQTCLFCTIPDKFGDASETLRMFKQWRGSFGDWPVAFVAQDGQEDLELPDDFDVLFVGGSTKWRLSDAAIVCIKRAQSLGKRVHIGRVNWRRRYNHFAGLPGGKEFTCDGTRPRYGREQALKDWIEYMESANQLHLDVFGSDNPR